MKLKAFWEKENLNKPHSKGKLWKGQRTLVGGELQKQKEITANA